MLLLIGQQKKGDFTWLIKLITTSVFADEWKKSTSDIRPFGKHASLVARCTRETHQGLAGLLQRLRDFQFKLPTDFLEKARKLVHRRKPSRQIIKSFTTISPDDHKFIEKHFHSAVSDLSNEFGTPALNATSGDPVFPEWIGAQKIALWNYGSGKLYLGLVDCRPAGEALVIGWWESEVGVLEPIVFGIACLGTDGVARHHADCEHSTRLIWSILLSKLPNAGAVAWGAIMPS